jgi:membrane protein YdbS with pleckstrin-like domain
MGYPARLLSPGEEIVRQFRPHWTAVLPQLGVTVGSLAAAAAVLVFLEGPARNWTLLAVAVLWLILTLPGFIDWIFTQHVITNERVIHRSGMISKRGKEIPLEMINTVAFSQSVFERLVGSGDLLIESAGETGQTHYTDIPHPERIQTVIYMARENRMLEMGGSARRVSTATAEQLALLSRLFDEGKLTDEEFQAEKRKLLGRA